MRKVMLVVISIIILCFTGCAKVTNSKTENIKATIVSTNYNSGYTTTTFIKSGNILVPMTNTVPDEYNIILEDDGIKYTVDSEEWYKLCKDKKGSKVSCELKILNYDDGSEEKCITKIIKFDEN